MMGKDPAHLTGEGYAKLASGVLRTAEGPDVVFSGGKRAHDGEEDRPAPTISGRKAWIYSSSSGHGRGGGRAGSRAVALLERPEGARPEGADPPTGAAA